jgi:hypothetical protein
VMNSASSDSKVKWGLVAACTPYATDGRLGHIWRVVWQWVPPTERAGIGDQLVSILANTKDPWTACDVAYALRKLDYAESVPAIRKILTTTSAPWRAWYCARLLEDFSDKDAGQALREALGRHAPSGHYTRDIAAMLFKVDGDSAVPAICEALLKQPEDVEQFGWEIGEDTLLRGLRVIMTQGTPDQKARAEALVSRLRAKAPAKMAAKKS